MHHFKGPSGSTFTYNSDLSGDVRINVGAPERDGEYEIDVPGADLLAFVAAYVAGRRIAALQMADDFEILGIDPKRQ